MSFFNKLFGKKNNKTQPDSEKENRSKYMPDIKLPIDERFTVNFNKNGGKFLYCENLNEVKESFEAILNENGWNNKKVLLLKPELNEAFKEFQMTTTLKPNEASFFLSTCEYLIADDGSLLICSNQIAEKKLNDLPEHFIIYATTSQLVETIGEGLNRIKANSTNTIPTNITTIKHFKTIEEKDFMTYGSSSKNLYLLLLEDL